MAVAAPLSLSRRSNAPALWAACMTQRSRFHPRVTVPREAWGSRSGARLRSYESPTLHPKSQPIIPRFGWQGPEGSPPGEPLSIHHMASDTQPDRRITVNSRRSPKESWQSLLSQPTIFVHHQLLTALEVPATLVVPAPACELLRLVSGRNSHEHAGTQAPQRRTRNLSVRLSQLLDRPNHHLDAWHCPSDVRLWLPTLCDRRGGE